MAARWALFLFAVSLSVQDGSAFLGSQLPLAGSRTCRQNSLHMSALDRRGVLKSGFSFATATVNPLSIVVDAGALLINSDDF